MLKRTALLIAAMIACSVATAHADDAEEAAAASADADAKDEPDNKVEEESFPVGGTVSMTYRFNHANFVDTKRVSDVKLSTLPGQEGTDEGEFGYGLLQIGLGAEYAITDSIGVSAGLGIDKALHESSSSAPTAFAVRSDVTGGTELTDVGLGVAWSKFATIPVVDINFSAGMDLGFPTSKASQTAGLIMSVSPNVSASWSMAGFSLSAVGVYSYFLNENPTLQMDCVNVPHLCAVSGQDVGQANVLHNITGVFGLGYKIIDGLKIGAKYTLVAGFGAVEFNDKANTASTAQLGVQRAADIHALGFTASYTLFEKTTFAAGMGTAATLYRANQKERTMPAFDFYNDDKRATVYSLSVSHSI